MRGKLVIAVLAAIVVAAAAVSLIVTRSRSTSPSAINPTPTPTSTRLVRHCSPSGCAVVSLSRSLPPLTILYGASCEGIEGSWFFNATEQGSNDELLPSYALQWSFMPGATEAMPNGRIIIQSTTSADVAITLANGALHLTGMRKPKPQVDATGTLAVRLSGSTSAPTLTFTETGLADAEKALGLVSPFDLGGNPLTVPVDMVKTMDGC